MKRGEQWRQADAWLERALRVPPGKRKALLDECPDEAIREEVLKLVELAERSGGALEPGAPLAQLDDDEVRAAFGLASPIGVGHYLADRYRLDERVGRGAMGEVFRLRRIASSEERQARACLSSDSACS